MQDKIITEDILAAGHFFFVGDRVRAENTDIKQVLTTFDQLLDVYVYVEGHPYLSATPAITQGTFTLTQRQPPAALKTTLTWAHRHIDVDQRHRELEQAVFDCLCAKHGKGAVFAEQDTGSGTKIDVVVRTTGGLWLYEIKTSSCIRTCIREGLAQLIEYAHWPPDIGATKLVIVGEPRTDSATRTYLEDLRSAYGLPIFYARLDFQSGRLGPEE